MTPSQDPPAPAAVASTDPDARPQGVAVLQSEDRLEVLRDLVILDTPPEPAYDDIASLAAASCRSKIAAVNFVDDKRHWTKAMVGAGDQGASVAADVSFCAATVVTDGGLLSIPDTLASEQWRVHPFVAGEPLLRFYAGAAIVVAGEPIGVVCIFGDEPREISEQEEQSLVALARQASVHLEMRRQNGEWRELAVTDPLTGLANRTLLVDHLELAIAQRNRSGDQVGVLYCDVDGFKQINDRWGHPAGDRVLCQIAERLREATRDSDSVARFGGDEFVIVCPGLHGAEELNVIIERIGLALHVTDPKGGAPGARRLTIGAVLHRDGETAANVLERADKAMYDGKAGRDAVDPEPVGD